MPLINLSSNIGLLAFALASVLYLLAVQRQQITPWAAKLAFAAFVCGTLAVSASLVSSFGETSFLDVSGLYLAASIGWLAVFGHILLNLKAIGTFVAPLATLMLLMQFFLVPSRGAAIAIGPATPFIYLHVIMAILGQAFAIIACAISILYLWQQALLKKKLLDQLPLNAPAIDRLDQLLMASLWCGFGFITLSLISGAYVVQAYARVEQGIDAKVLWAILVWGWYLATLLARNVFNKPAKRLAQMSLAGFVLLAFTYFGMGVFGPLGGI